MSELGLNEISKSLLSLYNVEIKKILLEISSEYNIDKNILLRKYINEDNLRKTPQKQTGTMYKCMARKQDGNQCSRRKKGVSDYCGKHMKNPKFGRIDDNADIVNTLAEDDNYIMTSLETIDGVEYLVDSNNILFTNDVDSPMIIGKKMDDRVEMLNIDI